MLLATNMLEYWPWKLIGIEFRCMINGNLEKEKPILLSGRYQNKKVLKTRYTGISWVMWLTALCVPRFFPDVKRPEKCLSGAVNAWKGMVEFTHWRVIAQFDGNCHRIWEQGLGQFLLCASVNVRNQWWMMFGYGHLILIMFCGQRWVPLEPASLNSHQSIPIKSWFWS